MINIKKYVPLIISTTIMAFLVIGIAFTWSVEGSEAGQALGALLGIGIFLIPFIMMLVSFIKKKKSR